ncbi:hypothetical protein [Xenophilus sp. Marseille-Q4582]|uniref:hypothetical protein n=1 Tax=Xenophilus sp. Marseille-Q4582 TaxID=2866600 RepID=UPI001CE4671F|nr:hypothetical protein [Xenophilus sp. Marseille-Q4582]
MAQLQREAAPALQFLALQLQPMFAARSFTLNTPATASAGAAARASITKTTTIIKG